MGLPLSEQLRPKELADVVGQDHLIGPKGMITSIIKSKKPLSIILWGPPGCGKTTIARLYAKAFSMHFETLSAVFSGITDLKKILKESDDMPLFKSSVLLFVDEIHRFNKSQQDAFLPFLENGKLVLVGATAENPSFYLNNALLSRVRVLKVNALQAESLEQIMDRYEKTKGLLEIPKEAKQYIIELAHGDGRYLLNLLENLEGQRFTSLEEMHNFLQERAALFDKGGDGHYNLISALHKSVRGSDPQASMYWFCRILEGGEDPLFLARRLIRMASEDIGLADPQALNLAIAAKSAYESLGSPEGELALAQVVVYLALAPKSNALYTAYGKAKQLAKATNHLDPPSIILNAPTALMKKMGYGKDYIYDHDTPDGFSGQNYFPEGLKSQKIYQPVERGFEREMQKRINYFERLKHSKNETQN